MTDFILCYFSATGNTKKCADLLFHALEGLGKTVSICKIEDGREKIKESGNIVIGYPVHGFGTPKNVISFAKNLPQGSGTAYIFKTSGEPLRLNDNSSSTLIGILKKKGYDVRGEYHYIMPYNMVFRHTDEMAAKMYKVAASRIPKDAEEMAAGKQTAKKILFRAKVASLVGKVEHFGAQMNGYLFRVKKDRCVGCGLCVKNCPTGNIRLEGGTFRFGGECLLCARCAFFCPKDAVRIGLMDFMRVNGPYDFDADAEKAEVGRYCRRSYDAYFARYDVRRGEEAEK